MFEWNDAWLDTRLEDVIEPDREIVDPHHHLWHREDRMRYLLDDLHADTGSGHRVVQTVFVECGHEYRTSGPDHLRQVGETEAVAQMALQSRTIPGAARVAGIVACTDIADVAHIDAALEAHRDAARGLLRGIRCPAAHDEDPAIPRSRLPAPIGLLRSPACQEGLRHLAGAGLSFDVWIYHHQLGDLLAAARAVPECTFVLDHLGGLLGIGPYAGRRAEILAQWSIDMAAVAACPNVTMKLGGLGMTMFGRGFELGPTAPSSDDLVASWGDTVHEAIDLFGVDRCMFESNFPVDRQSCSYRTLWNAFKKIAAGASGSEKTALFSGTARRVYGVTA